MDKSLTKQLVDVFYCPSCNAKIENTGNYNNETLYYCRPCKKAYPATKAVKCLLEQYVYYDKKGRFTPNQMPWNKGRITGRHPFREIQEVLTSNGATVTAALFNETFYSNVRWESIDRIEEINYDGFVYDFVVPEVENFVAG